MIPMGPRRLDIGVFAFYLLLRGVTARGMMVFRGGYETESNGCWIHNTLDS